MQITLENTVLHLIIQDWQGLSITARPWGMWIRACAPIEAEANQLDIRLPPYRAWFLDRQGLHERTVWEWTRFRVVQIEQPWCQRAFAKESTGVFGRRHEIGLAAFASYRDGTAVYLEVQWGGLFGRGWRVGIDSDGSIVERHTLWVT